MNKTYLIAPLTVLILKELVFPNIIT